MFVILSSFYWSDDCKALAHVYEELATKYKASDKVTVAKVGILMNLSFWTDRQEQTLWTQIRLLEEQSDWDT